MAAFAHSVWFGFSAACLAKQIEPPRPTAVMPMGSGSLTSRQFRYPKTATRVTINATTWKKDIAVRVGIIERAESDRGEKYPRQALSA